MCLCPIYDYWTYFSAFIRAQNDVLELSWTLPSRVSFQGVKTTFKNCRCNSQHVFLLSLQLYLLWFPVFGLFCLIGVYVMSASVFMWASAGDMKWWFFTELANPILTAFVILFTHGLFTLITRLSVHSSFNPIKALKYNRDSAQDFSMHTSCMHIKAYTLTKYNNCVLMSFCFYN